MGRIKFGHEVPFCNFSLLGAGSGSACPNSSRFGKIPQDISSQTTESVNSGASVATERRKWPPDSRKKLDFGGYPCRHTDVQTDIHTEDRPA